MPARIPIDGQVLRRLRKDRMWSQADAAREANRYAERVGESAAVTRETVSKLECARLDKPSGRYPSPYTLRYLVGALRPTIADMKLLLGGRPPRRLIGLCSDAPGARGAKEADDVNRRQAAATAMAAALAGLGATGTAVAAVEQLTGRRWRVDDGLLGILEAETAAEKAAYPQGAERIDGHQPWTHRARIHLNTLTDLLGGSMLPTQRQRLVALAGAQAIMLGAMVRNAGQWGEALRLTTQGVFFAREAGSPPVLARSLGGMAQLYEGVDEPRRALYAKAADLAARSAPMQAESRSWLLTEHALGLALSGDRDGFEAAMDGAERALGVHPPKDDLLGRFSGTWGPVQIADNRGRGYVLLHDPKAAKAVLEPVVQEGYRSRAKTALGEALAQDREPEAAAAWLEQALQDAVAIDAGWGVRFVQAAVNNRIREWAEEPFMQPLHQRLQLIGL